MKLRGQSNLHPLCLHLVSRDFVRLMIKFDALLFASLVILLQTV